MDEFNKQLKALQADNRSGSGDILARTQELLLGWLDLQTVIYQESLMALLKPILTRHRSFASLWHFTLFLLRQIEVNNQSVRLKDGIRQYRQHWDQALSRAAEMMAFEAIKPGDCILVHSNSTAIRQLFTALAGTGKPARVIQTSSGPADEDKLQAGFIHQMGFQVTYIHDTAVSRFLDEIDLAVFGPDWITTDYFINKSGTCPISLLMHQTGKPVWLLCDSRKTLNPGKKIGKLTIQPRLDESHASSELWKDPPEGISVRNHYFEKIPMRFVTGIWTEQGCMDPAKVATATFYQK